MLEREGYHLIQKEERGERSQKDERERERERESRVFDSEGGGVLALTFLLGKGWPKPLFIWPKALWPLLLCGMHAHMHFFLLSS